MTAERVWVGEKGWARRSVVVRGVEPSGAAVFEAVPGREEYGSGEEGGGKGKVEGEKGARRLGMF